MNALLLGRDSRNYSVSIFILLSTHVVSWKDSEHNQPSLLLGDLTGSREVCFCFVGSDLYPQDFTW